MNEPRRTFSITSHRLALGTAIVGTLAATAALAIGCAPDNYHTPFSSWSAAEAKPEAEGAQAAPAEPGGDHMHHMPPPQAFDACKEKQAGDACNVQLGENEIAGKCDPAPPGAVQGGLACRPDGEARRHHGPPPEIVFAACNGKTAGDPCSVEHESRTVNGSGGASTNRNSIGRLAPNASIWRLMPAASASTRRRVCGSVASTSRAAMRSMPTVRCAMSLAR